MRRTCASYVPKPAHSIAFRGDSVLLIAPKFFNPVRASFHESPEKVNASKAKRDLFAEVKVAKLLPIGITLRVKISRRENSISPLFPASGWR